MKVSKVSQHMLIICKKQTTKNNKELYGKKKRG